MFCFWIAMFGFCYNFTYYFWMLLFLDLMILGCFSFWMLQFLPIFFVLKFFDFSIFIIFLCYHFMLTFVYIPFSVIIWDVNIPRFLFLLKTWNTPYNKVIFNPYCLKSLIVRVIQEKGYQTFFATHCTQGQGMALIQSDTERRFTGAIT